MLRQLEATPVDVVPSDIRMPGLDGIDALRRLRERATILDKLDTRDRTRAVLKAIRLRVIRPARFGRLSVPARPASPGAARCTAQ